MGVHQSSKPWAMARVRALSCCHTRVRAQTFPRHALLWPWVVLPHRAQHAFCPCARLPGCHGCLCGCGCMHAVRVTQHEVWNNDTTARYVLHVDMWHPGLFDLIDAPLASPAPGRNRGHGAPANAGNVKRAQQALKQMLQQEQAQRKSKGRGGGARAQEQAAAGGGKSPSLTKQVAADGDGALAPDSNSGGEGGVGDASARAAERIAQLEHQAASAAKVMADLKAEVEHIRTVVDTWAPTHGNGNGHRTTDDG